MRFENGRLLVTLPSVLDAINGRVLRKLVLLRIHDCQAIEFDATRLSALGDVGAAALWQTMTIAESQGIDVGIFGASALVYDRLIGMRRQAVTRGACTHGEEFDLMLVLDPASARRGKPPVLKLRRSNIEVNTEDGADEGKVIALDERRDHKAA